MFNFYFLTFLFPYIYFCLFSSNRTKVSSHPEYTLTKEDVDHRMVFGYTPVNILGQEGEYVEVKSSIVQERPSAVSLVPVESDDHVECL